jgi:hypothetical protein
MPKKTTLAGWTRRDQETYDQLLKKLTRLRQKYERSEVEFFLFLREASKEHEELINNVHGSFSAFLRDTGLCDEGRFGSFCNGLERTDDGTARKIGTNMVIALAKAEREEFVQTAIQYALDSVEKRGVCPSQKLAADFMIKSRARDQIPRATQEKTLIASLQAELQKVKADLRASEAKNRKLMQRIEQLEKQLGKQPSASV